MSKLSHNIDECISSLTQNGRRNLNILCFGDSLTSGYQSGGFKHTPYSDTLSRLIQSEYADKMKISVIESGVNGECVTDTMEQRLIEHMKHTAYDIVIILGGTNDIGSNVSTDCVTTTLNELYQLVTISYNAKCIAVTIPPYQKNNVYEDLEKKQNEINKFIKNQQCVYLCDLHEYVTALDNKQKGQFYDDFLHFTESGYQQFGELVFETIRPILFQSTQQ